MAVLATRARTASGWPWCVLIAAAVAVCWTSTLRGASAAPPSEVTRTLANGETECDVALLADGRPVLALLNSLYICNDETCSSPVQRLIEPGLTTYSAPGVRDMAVADVVVPPSNLPVALLHAGLVLCGDADCSTFVVRNVSAAVGGMPHRQCSVVRVSPTTGQPALAVAVRRPMVSGGPATTSDIDTLPDVHWVACADATCTSFAHSRVIFSSDWFLVYGLDAAFLADGRPVVAINGGAAGLDMHLVVCTDISCASTTSTALDTSTAFNSFSTPCLRILASGFPGILFADFDVGRVQLVVCTSATCTSRTTRTVYEDSSAIGYNKVAQNPTFELLPDGRPVIVFQSKQDRIIYVVCNDATCASATTHQIVSGTFEFAKYTAVAVASDMFHVIHTTGSAISTEPMGYHGTAAIPSCTGPSCLAATCAGTGLYLNDARVTQLVREQMRGASSTLSPCSDFACAAGTSDDDGIASTACISCSAGTHAPAGSTGVCSALACAAGTSDTDGSSVSPCVACSVPNTYVPSGSFGACSNSKFLCASGTADLDSNNTTPCVASNSTITASSSSASSVGIYAGAGAGAVALIVLVILLVVVRSMRRTRNEANEVKRKIDGWLGVEDTDKLDAEQRAIIDGAKGSAFLSYAWGKQDPKTKLLPNQLIVNSVASALHSRGIKVWLDTEKMKDDMYMHMALGVRHCAVFVACVSNEYHNPSSNAAMEFRLACDLKKPMVAVRAAPDVDMRQGAVGLRNAGQIYYNACCDHVSFAKEMDKLANIIRDKMDMDMGTAVGDGKKELLRVDSSGSAHEMQPVSVGLETGAGVGPRTDPQLAPPPAQPHQAWVGDSQGTEDQGEAGQVAPVPGLGFDVVVDDAPDE